jgi:SdrD B-like domain
MSRPMHSLRALINGWRRPASPRRQRVNLCVEELDDRLVPSTMLDLSTTGSIGSINGAIFRQAEVQPAGCGVMDPFVRLQAKGVTQGYNTDGRPLQFDEKSSANFTRSELMSAVPQVNIGGVTYKEFLLNINQTNSTPLLSLDELRIYTGDAPDLLNYNSTTRQLAGINPGFDLGDHWIELNSGLNPGNGKANMVALIPSAELGAGKYVYLYSKFGVNLPAHGGFESWGVNGSGTPLTDISGTISGNVFNDLNQDHVRDFGELGLAGWTVSITSGVPGATPVSVQTDAFGNYSFSNLATGLGSFSDYTIGITQQGGWTATTPTTVTIDLSSAPGHSAIVNFGEFNTGSPPPNN